MSTQTKSQIINYLVRSINKDEVNTLVLKYGGNIKSTKAKSLHTLSKKKLQRLKQNRTLETKTKNIYTRKNIFSCNYIIPGVTSLALLSILEGCLVFNIPVRALYKAWYEILKIAEPFKNNTKLNCFERLKHAYKKINSYTGTYDSVQSKWKKSVGKKYQETKYNFLVHWWITGKCNCLCGSMMVLAIAQYWGCSDKVGLLLSPGHARIYIHENSEHYVWETTTKEIKFQKVDINDRVNHYKILLGNNKRSGFAIILFKPKEIELFQLQNMLDAMISNNVKKETEKMGG